MSDSSSLLGQLNFMPLLVHEQACDTTRAGVAVLVRAPHRKVDVPGVQLDGNVCERMGEVPADDTALCETGATLSHLPRR